MEPVLCFPDPVPEEIAQALEGAGYAFVAASDSTAAGRDEPEEGYLAAVVSALDNKLAAFDFCRTLRKRETPVSPLLLIINRADVGELAHDENLFDDFVIAPLDPQELDARLSHLLWQTGRGKQHDLIVYGPLALNLETYQAVVSGRPLDLTFMEYELLRFLAAHPGSVFTREVLLSRVWGYEYFGGARTVDVHIRRLRAKLGEEHANLIETVRSVGYRFGRVRWSA
jgi:DNA-binding response OmpR family regulator